MIDDAPQTQMMEMMMRMKLEDIDVNTPAVEPEAQTDEVSSDLNPTFSIVLNKMSIVDEHMLELRKQLQALAAASATAARTVGAHS